MADQVVVTEAGDLSIDGRSAIEFLGMQGGSPPSYVLFAPLELVSSASVASLQEALGRWFRFKQQEGEFLFEAGNGRLWLGLSEQSAADLKALHDPDDDFWFHPFMEVPPTNPALFVDEDHLGVRITAWRRERPEPKEIEDVLAPYLQRYEASCDILISAVSAREGGEGFDVVIELDRSYPPDSTIGDAFKFGSEARTLLDVSKGDEIPKSLAVDLLCAGKWDLFYGQPESDWLEAKAQPYDHLLEKGKDAPRLELAKDVAALANTPEGGIIVIGLSTEDRGDGDVINGHLEFDLKRVRGSAYRQQISQLVYPDVAGLEITRIEGPNVGEGIAVVVVPPQPKSSRPFLVKGFLLEEKVLGGYFLLPVRRGADTALTDIGLIHARLRLGQRVIDGEESLPD